MVDAAGSLLDGLDAEQRAAVTAARGPVCVLAGAGTGKTRTITHRIAHLVGQGEVLPGQVLAVTFTARAAGELRDRLRRLGVHGVQARTFHAAALRQLRYFWPRVADGEPWSLVDNKLGFVARAAHRVGAGMDTEAVRDVAGEIEWAKASLITPAGYPAAVDAHDRVPPMPAAQVAEVYATYEELRTTARQVDFDDLLLRTSAALAENAEVAAEFRHRYRSFVVDEFQDITPLQQRLLDAWLGERDDLTVVGDANQTIYSFAGASPRPLLDFRRRFPNATVLTLARDYRSTPQVVALANTVIDAARDRPAGARLRLRGQRPDGPTPVFAEYDDETVEASSVAATIAKLLADGVAASQVAVLFRVNAQSESYERALSEAGIAYQVRAGERFFQRAEIRQAMLALRQATAAPAGTNAELALPDRVRAVLAGLGLTDEPPAGGAARQRWESLLALVEIAEETAATIPAADLSRFVAELHTRAEAQHPPVVEGVTLASLHAAKGLEWDAVFLVGLVEGTLPIQHALGAGGGDRQADVEEERRLLYVGVTRARERLWLSWALSRQPGGRPNRRRSRFLHGLLPDDHPAVLPAKPRRSATVSRTRPGPDAVPSCRICGGPLVGTVAVKLGRCASCPSDVDEGLLARLKEWRSRRAKQLRVPAFVVFTDATLTAIAEQRPVDTAALVGIPGIGAGKLNRFGADVLALVRDSAAEAEAESGKSTTSQVEKSVAGIRPGE